MMEGLQTEHTPADVFTQLWSIWVSLSNAANTVTQRNAVAVCAHHMYGVSSCVTSGSGALFMCCNS